MASMEIKGITKLEIENPADVISSLFTRIPDRYNSKRNPANGRKLITNIPTQLLGNRTVNAVCVWESGDSEIEVSLDSFMPARNMETDSDAKEMSGQFYKAYRFGKFPDDRTAAREFLAVLSYMTVCLLTGQLPTPSKRSGQSTIMSTFVEEMLADAKLKPVSIKVVGGNGVEMTYTPNQFEQTISLYHANADDILTNWNDSKRSANAGSDINWA